MPSVPRTRETDYFSTQALDTAHNIAVYNFGDFLSYSVDPNPRGLAPDRIFDLWQIAVDLWLLVVWTRRTVQFAGNSDRGWQRVLRALGSPQEEEARVSRTWLLLHLLTPLPTLASTLEPTSRIPNIFPITCSIVMFIFFVAYTGRAPEALTFLVRLVGAALLGILLFAGAVSHQTMMAQQALFFQVRLAEVELVQMGVALGQLDALPAAVRYLAVRAPDGLFADRYDVLLSRDPRLTGETLARWDAFWRERLARGDHWSLDVLACEHPWLGFDGLLPLLGNPKVMDRLSLPEHTPMYRGATAPPGEHFLRYVFYHDGAQYEVGFDYLEYRRFLHRAALSLSGMMVGVTVVATAALSLFFKMSLVNSLTDLLKGITRVDQGDLSVTVPVHAQDEIGALARAFNLMIGSLRAARDDLRTLNRALEQRIVERNHELATLYEISLLINQACSVDELFSLALRRVLPNIGGEAGMILLPDEKDTLVLAASWGMAPTLAEKLAASPLWNRLRAEGGTLLLHNLAESPRLAEMLPADEFVDFPYQTLASIPLPAGNGDVGLMVYLGRRAYMFGMEQLELMEAVARQLGAAQENIRWRERLAIAAVTEERHRLARDLHDSVTQLLYSQVLFADASAKAIRAGETEAAQTYLARLGESAFRALREMRLMLYRLRPPDLTKMGLAATLRQRLDTVEQCAVIQTYLHYDLPARLPHELEQSVYYILEEALNNALKHANADRVWVDIGQRSGYLVVQVRDDGCGFDPAQVSGGMGLQGICERVAQWGGRFRIRSRPGGGTRLTVILPLK